MAIKITQEKGVKLMEYHPMLTYSNYLILYNVETCHGGCVRTRNQGDNCE